MLDTIKQFLKEHEIDEKAGFIIAVSGGADSITLLHAFKYLNLRIHALHCNFNLRGKESNMDEQFVKRFCETYGIPMSVKRFDTQEYAKKKGISIEMAARELRYDWFEEMRQKKKMDYIVVGHHADDLAETLFIYMPRNRHQGSHRYPSCQRAYSASAPVPFPGRDPYLHRAKPTGVSHRLHQQLARLRTEQNSPHDHPRVQGHQSLVPQHGPGEL